MIAVVVCDIGYLIIYNIIILYDGLFNTGNFNLQCVLFVSNKLLIINTTVVNLIIANKVFFGLDR